MRYFAAIPSLFCAFAAFAEEVAQPKGEDIADCAGLFFAYDDSLLEFGIVDAKTSRPTDQDRYFSLGSFLFRKALAAFPEEDPAIMRKKIEALIIAARTQYGGEFRKKYDQPEDDNAPSSPLDERLSDCFSMIKTLSKR